MTQLHVATLDGNKWTRPLVVFGLILLVPPTAMRAQDLANDVVVSFSHETIRVEFSRPAKLRELPTYASLRERYTAPRLLALEAALSKLGIQEGNIDEIVLAWHAIKKNLKPDDSSPGSIESEATVEDRMARPMWPTQLDGLAAGQFDLKAIVERAAAEGIAATTVAERTAYCFEAEEATCVLFLSESLGAFGPRSALTKILETRSGQGTSLTSHPQFLRLLQEVHMQPVIWGIAVGPGVADWFQGWLPGQKDLPLDWSQVLESVEALIYTVEVSEKVHLEVKLDCATPEAAASLMRIFEGLHRIQQHLWQKLSPNRLNPLRALEVQTSGRRMCLKLTTAPTEIQEYASFPFRAPEK